MSIQLHTFDIKHEFTLVKIFCYININSKNNVAFSNRLQLRLYEIKIMLFLFRL